MDFDIAKPLHRRIDIARTLHRRNQLNIHFTPKGYFTVLDEVCRHLADRMHKHGYSLKDCNYIDRKLGRLFSDHLKSINAFDCITVDQVSVDNTKAEQCNAYSLKLKKHFKPVIDQWIDGGGAKYVFHQYHMPIAYQALKTVKDSATKAALQSRAKAQYKADLKEAESTEA